MKKFVSGVIVGAIIATTGTAFASGSVNAVLADFNFLVNGKQTVVADTPLVKDGSSYLPVRAISNALGYEVQYDDSSRTISLSNDGKKYLKDENTGTKAETKVEEQVSGEVKGNFVKDLKDKYTVDNKLNADKIAVAIASGELPINAQDEATGDSLLILAIRDNNYAVYQILVSAGGVDPELANKEGKTPLHIAVIEKNSFYFGQLLNQLNVNAKLEDNYGKKAIDYAEEDSSFQRGLKPYSK